VIALTAALVVAVGAWGLPSAPAQGSDTVTVTDEPPGENCEFGGVKITVTHVEPEPTEEPTPEPTEEPTPDPTEEPTPDPTETPEARAGQAPEVTYVCSGQQGAPGDPGDNGDNGEDGRDGMDGLDGMDSDPDTPGVQARRSDRCATAGIIRVKVPKRFRNGARVRVTANGQRSSRRRVRNRKVSANLRAVPCGYYPVLVQRRNVRSYVTVLWLTPRRVARVSAN
jgi:hypothetical protein